MKSLKLPADMRIGAAAAVRDRLLAALEGAGPLRLHGREVARLDASGIQLLVAAAAEAGRRGRELRLASASETLATAVQRLGLQETLSLPDKKGAAGRRPKV
ncbi:MAG TPA: STAS domain-containing protein [Gammaproteobacteria bacterium]|nr:STAS domain-containing protein [Gammaproteobacteria bacterium]